MLQRQGAAECRQEPAAQPSRGHRSKWWHVPDGHIEDLIRQLNDPRESTSETHGYAGSASTRKTHGYAGTALRDGSMERSVRVSFSDPQEDALDRALLDFNKVLQRNDYEPKARVKGSWKVPDEHILEFIHSAKKVLAMEVEETSAMLEANTVHASASRTALKNAGGRLVTGQHASTGPANSRHDGAAIPPSARSRNARVAKDLSTRPPWVKSESMPNLFGVEPKGRPKMKAGMCRFEETPIYLSDSQDRSMGNVRVNVCGHPYYM